MDGSKDDEYIEGLEDYKVNRDKEDDPFDSSKELE